MPRDTSDGTSATGYQSRRRYLGGLVALGAVTVAGCSGGSGSGGDTEGDDGDTGGGGGASTSSETGTAGGGGGCPSLPLSYAEKRTDGSPAFAFEGPSNAEYTFKGGDDDGTSTVAVRVPLTDGDTPWLVNVTGILQESSTVEAAIETDSSLTDNAEEVTSEYDLTADAIRVFFFDTRGTYEVYLPAAKVVQASVSPLTSPGDVACSDAATATIDHVLETLRAV